MLTRETRTGSGIRVEKTQNRREIARIYSTETRARYAAAFRSRRRNRSRSSARVYSRRVCSSNDDLVPTAIIIKAARGRVGEIR